MSEVHEFSGNWHCSYWFPSNNHDGEDISEYDVTAEQAGNQLVLQSIPNPEGSYIFVRLMLDHEYAAGSWTENTSPTGEFAGMIYSGVMQLIIDDDKQSMTGKWVGIGRDLQKKQPGIFGGRWELKREDTL